MAPFWRNGARTPGVDEWAAVLGADPVLILLDELPSYLQMAQGERVNFSTLGDLTIGALERLFNALPRCPRACVVVTNLKDDVYLVWLPASFAHTDREFSRSTTTATRRRSPRCSRTPARCSPSSASGSSMDCPASERIDEVAQAYVSALQKAKRVDTIPTTPETFVERIRETYPFHPSIRDIVARFAENRGYQKTRALIRLLPLGRARRPRGQTATPS